MAKKKTSKIVVPALIETKDFKPTQAQIKFAFAFAREVELPPTALLKKLGHSPALWTQWRQNGNFRPWLESVVKDYMKTTALSEVWKATYASAISKGAKGAVDRQTFLKRFDGEFVPASKLEISPGAGRRPPDQTDEEIRNRCRQRHKEFEEAERERKATESIEVDNGDSNT
ncbi:MAG: hypothetical protein ACYS1A_18130 [Planctomycetota bacterium]